jgi:hypothetical protein
MSLENFIVLRNCSTCFGDSYAHHQEPETLLVIVCGAWCCKDGRMKVKIRVSVSVFKRVLWHLRVAVSCVLDLLKCVSHVGCVMWVVYGVRDLVLVYVMLWVVGSVTRTNILLMMGI